MENATRNYETRQKTKPKEPIIKSRIDWKRTARNCISQIVWSDNEYESISEEQVEGDGGSSSTAEENEEIWQQKITVSAVDIEEEECIIQSKCKRTSAVMYDSDSSSDSDILVRKVYAKRRCILDEDDEPCDATKNMCLKIDTEVIEIRGASEDEPAETNIKKQEKLENLKQLAKKQRSRRRSNGYECFEDSEGDSYGLPLTPEKTSDNEDSNSMKDFIVNDEGEYADEADAYDHKDGIQIAVHQELFSKHHIPLLTHTDLYDHLQRAIKAFLINIVDQTFLTTLYEGTRKKKYAKEMLNSFFYLEERVILPRLENLKTRSRWRQRYRERVECYPQHSIILKGPQDRSCQACELHRICRFEVILSGQSYNNKTLENDDFMSNDKQVLLVGKTCANRTRVYHQLKHFKYHLYQHCKAIPGIDEIQDKSAKEIVERCFSMMEEKGWIKKEFDLLENYLNEADYFQEEKID
ncbi:coiled-coil domain-containing protein 82 isoform X2 [Ascaphus truei]|uniref:coiled-coil domain-containing protein 82 isoform X2 n=1 Tax=Ascaphus truei TaxID=8439 RepID=UPI003F5ACC2A